MSGIDINPKISFKEFLVILLDFCKVIWYPEYSVANENLKIGRCLYDDRRRSDG
jgi:hypothetical protein